MLDDPLALTTYATEHAARQAIIDCALQMNAMGINHGKAGNVSCRWDRSAAPGFLITPSALAFHRLEPGDLVWMRFDRARDAALNDLDEPIPSSEWRFHHDLYLHRPEIRALVHTHSVFATSLACMARVQGQGLPAFHYMVASCGGLDIRCASYETYGTQALSHAVLIAMENRLACLMANHGQLAAGTSLYAALSRAQEVEKLSQIYWQALQLGEPVMLSQTQMDEVLDKFKSRF